MGRGKGSLPIRSQRWSTIDDETGEPGPRHAIHNEAIRECPEDQWLDKVLDWRSREEESGTAKGDILYVEEKIRRALRLPERI